MNIEELVTAVTDGAAPLLSCLCQPVVAYHVTAIMREADFQQAREMQVELLRRTFEALVADGLEDSAAEHFASSLADHVDEAWKRLHAADGTWH
jgi:hypothetical protein